MRGGLGGVFSKGMNYLEDSLEDNCSIHATSTVWYKAHALSAQIIDDLAHKKIHKPIILVGHSLGANEQIKVARELARFNVPVALIITVDAVSPVTVPANVSRVLNIYKPSFIPLFSGLIVKAMDTKKTQVENVKIDNLGYGNINHFTIDGNQNVQQLMLEQILKTLNLKNHCVVLPKKNNTVKISSLPGV